MVYYGIIHNARFTNMDLNNLFSAYAVEYAMAVGIELGLVVKAKGYHIRDMRCKCWVPI